MGVKKNAETGEVTEIRCTYDPDSRGGQAPDRRRVRGTLHWVSAPQSIGAEVRLYDHLFTVEKPEEGSEGYDYKECLNPNSLVTVTSCRLEPSLARAKVGIPYQFERIGYFCLDGEDSFPGAPVFNRTVPLRDSWRKGKRGKQG